MRKKCILGMDIGGTNFRMGLVDERLCADKVEVYPSKDIYGGGHTVENFASCIRNYADRHGDGHEILAVFIGCPSVVDRQRRRLYSSTNFPGLEKIDLVEELENRLPYPVMIDHDAYCLLAYDIYQSGVNREGTIAGIYFGTGLGNAVYIGGKPYIGKNGTACELGHLVVPFSSRPCSCGNAGCIEMFSCGKALEEIQKTYFPEDHIGDLFVKHGREQVLRDFVEYMSVAVAAEVNILDPDYVFVGGGLAQMEGFPRDELRERVLSHTRKPYPAENLDLRFSKAGPENGIVGAAIRAFETLPLKNKDFKLDTYFCWQED